jgi:hypothetical protein
MLVRERSEVLPICAKVQSSLLPLIFRIWGVRMSTKAFCFFLALLSTLVAHPVSAAASEIVRYRMPVDGTIIDAFRPPSHPYGPGNRGWELQVDLWSNVVAPADGIITFAGQVGGTSSVVIQHADGVRTTLSKLDEIEPGVEKGASVVAGQRIGEASGSLYFGARCGSVYIDPALLFDLDVFLVPLNGTASEQQRSSVCSSGESLSGNVRDWLTGPAEQGPEEDGRSLLDGMLDAAIELVARWAREREINDVFPKTPSP